MEQESKKRPLEEKEENETNSDAKKKQVYNSEIDYILDDDWKKVLSPEFEKDYMRKIFKFLTKERNERATIFPPEHEIFSAFNLTPLKEIKVVIIGQDPYHDVGQAHGLCFSVKKGIDIPPSLKNIYKELTNDIPGFKAPNHGHLEHWAKQGVLMINATLTVEAHKPNSHKDIGWLTFTNAVLKIINSQCDKVVFILWGMFAQKVAQDAGISQFKHLILKAAHPSPLSATKFFGCKVFSRTNKYLEKIGKEPINWNFGV